jgi:hypothetical protein
MTRAELDRFAMMNARGEHIDPEVIGDLIAEIRRLRLAEDAAKEVMGGPVVTDGRRTIFNSHDGPGSLFTAPNTMDAKFQRSRPGDVFSMGDRLFRVEEVNGRYAWRETNGWI